jgi:arginase
MPIRRLIERVTRTSGHLHLSLDIDAMDPGIAPGVGTTVPGGLTYREAHLVMEMLHDAGIVGSLDIVELNPFLDHAGMSAKLLVDLAASRFGRKIVSRPR